MKHPNGVGPASALTENEALEVCSTAKTNKQGSKAFPQKIKQAVRAELTESDTATALGTTGRGNAPVLDLCRKLVGAGHDPDQPLEAYRGDTLCLIVRSIGEASRLEINGDGTGFRPRRQPDAAPPIAPKAKCLIQPHKQAAARRARS
jgi:hypothetical protein